MAQRVTLVNADFTAANPYDNATNTFNVQDVSPALMQYMAVNLLNAVTATGASITLNVSNLSKHTFHIVSTSVNTQGIIQIQTALDTANFVTTNIVTITSAGNSEVVLNNKYAYVRANVSARSDGTFTVNYIGGF